VVDERPIDGSRWGEWVGAGGERWEVVRRSWTVFTRNTTELMALLNIPVTNVAFALQLMGDDRETTDPFWEELDQRLHNQLSSSESLIDHERRLLRYYEPDFPAVAAEYKSRVASVAGMNEAVFLGDLRNYLLHYGAPPIIHTLRFGVTDAGTSGHLVKLSATQLLKWKKWTAPARDYLSSFDERDGPVIGRDVAAYANAVSGLAIWIFEQRKVVMDSGNIPDRLRMDA
jgi:hypothetical protein